MAFNRESAYRAGNKVYGSGRNSPHMGTRLDPSGYIQRELDKQRLDRRSRLAQGALRRLSGGRPDTQQTARERTRTMNPPTSTGGPDSPPVFNQIGATSNKGPKGGGGNNNPPPTEEPQGPFTPPKVDLNGKLIPMPWEMQMNWMNAAIDLANQNASWDQQVGQAGIDLGITLRDLARQKVVDSRDIAGHNASRGMTFSSGNAQDITENEAMYGEANAQAQNWYDNINSQYGVGGTQRALAQSSFDQYAAMLQAEAARRLAAQAGKLGLGQDNSYDPNIPPGYPDKPDPRPRNPGGKGGKNKPRNRRNR